MTIDVETDGLPTPAIAWKLPSGDRLSAGESSGRASVLANNSLVVRGLQRGDAGTYTAIASNNAGLARARSRIRTISKFT